MKARLYIPTIILVSLLLLDSLIIAKSKDKLANSQPIKAFENTQAYVLPIAEANYLPVLDSAIEKPNLKAKSVLVFDTSSARVLFEKNSDQKLAIASLTKILTTIVVLEKYNLTDVVTIQKDWVKVDNEKQYLYADEQLTVADLIKMMLVESSNDAAYALAGYGKEKGIDLVAEMNKKAADLGMKDSLFYDPAGLNDSAYSTASDLERLLEYSISVPQLWDITREKQITIDSIGGKFKHVVDTTDKLLDEIPNIYGGKTGYTDSALGCMILLVNITGQDTRVISVVLGSNDRFGETKQVIDWVTRAYRWTK